MRTPPRASSVSSGSAAQSLARALGRVNHRLNQQPPVLRALPRVPYPLGTLEPGLGSLGELGQGEVDEKVDGRRDQIGRQAA